MDDRDSPRGVLLYHDGELADVASIVAELGVPITERSGIVSAEGESEAWDLVVASPARLFEIGSDPPAGSPVRLAILDRSTRTLLALLERAGVDLWVRRPVHPAALRLLLLHALYRGPEKRRRRRVSVGTPVRFRAGFRSRRAILADLSIRGCRLLTRHAARHGAPISISIPAKLSGAALRIRGRVTRTGPASGEDAGTQVIAVVFDSAGSPLQRKLQQIVDAHQRSPAVLDRRVRRSAQGERAGRERRADPRRTYRARVIALGERAARIVIGRNLSPGGMRIDPHRDLAVGDSLQIAVHVNDCPEPLVVRARVSRDEGERGQLLRFHELTPDDRDRLHKMVSALPVEGQADARLAGGGVIVSEILERRQAASDQHTPR